MKSLKKHFNEKTVVKQEFSQINTGKNLIFNFEKQVKKNPTAVAIIDGNTKISYLDLDILSNQLANQLQRKGVQDEEIIAILLPRSAQYIISVLAIIKTGAAYLPLHLSESESRLKHMITESACKLVISNRDDFDWKNRVEIVNVAEILHKENSIEEQYTISKDIHPSQLAYVMYTSGSTGSPKGVCITHYAIASFAADPLWNAENQSKVLFHSHVAFDASTFELWVPLLNGGTIVIAKEDSFNVDYLVKLIAKEKITSIFLTTMLFNLLAQEKGVHLCDVNQILFGGEQCSEDCIDKMRQKLPDTDIVHVYGPTETTTFFSAYLIPSDEILTTVPIGKPMDKMYAYILDNDFEPAREKEIGELYISSAGLARGYLNQPSLTADKFLPDPFSLNGARMYRTGDLVYRNENGELVYIGRIDQQVKVRGFRVELGEIEKVLQSHPNVSQSSVIAQKSENGNQLLAYIVPDYSVEASSSQLKEEQILEWEKIYDEVYQNFDLTSENSEFVGWNSSFDGKPIALPHMHEWLDMTLKRIKKLNPEKVLEIGVGTGMLFKNLYEETEIYWGTDLSEKTIIKLNSFFEKEPVLSTQIKLFHQLADSIDTLPKQMFDTIIINSVCQYFPDVNYFVDVLNKAMDLLSPSGKIFIGDIRDLRLQRHFYTEIHLHNKKITTEAQLITAIERDMMMESELLISPDFFSVWSKTRSDIVSFETKLKDGIFINEMSQYRYDAVVYKKSGKEEKSLCCDKKILDWAHCDFQQVENIIKENKTDSLYIKGFPNERIAAVLRATDKLSNNENLEAIQDAYAQCVKTEPQLAEFQTLAKKNNYEMSVVHPQSGNCAFVDLVFIHKSLESLSYSKLYQNESLPGNLTTCANYPPISRKINQLLIQIKNHLQKKLPEYMWPSTIIPINKMPLTSRGKINKDSLLALSVYKNSGGRKANTYVEAIVCQLFGEVLGLSEISLDDHFFEMGGNSLSVIVLLNRFRDVLNIDIPIKIFFENPTPAMLIKKLDFNSEISFQLHKQQRPNDIPLSFSQQRLWFLFNLEGANETYNIPMAIKLSGKLSKKDLTNALNDVIERHESLRTIFYEKEGVPYQKILNDVCTDIEMMNVDKISLQSSINESSGYVFNLSEEIPIKAKLFCVDDNTHILLVIIHHIAFDGWSLAPFWRDLSIAYSASLNNQTPDWNALPVQYADYAIWQRNTFQTEMENNSTIDRQLNYWNKNLDNLPALVSLPCDYFRPAKPAYKGMRKTFVIPSKLHNDLVLLSNNQNVTLFMTLHAGLCCLLNRFNAGTDIVIGTPVAGRKGSGVRDLIGFFVNNLVLRIDTSGNPSFQNLLKKVKEQDLSAYAHQDIPFERLVQELKQSGTTSWHPLFQIVLAFQNQPQPQINFSGIDSGFELMENKSCRFDLVINLFAENQTEKDIEGFVEYNTDLFKAATIDHFIESYILLLKSIVENPEYKIDELDINSNGLKNLYKKQSVTCEEEHFASLFQNQASLTPHAVALSHENAALTYKDLGSAVNRLARLLISKGIGPEKVVAVSIPRSLDWIIATLAILKSGAAYMPIDSQFPEERINYMLEKSRVSLLLTTADLAPVFSFTDKEKLVLDDPETCKTLNSLSNSKIQPSELSAPLLVSSPAYVIYTSGSSGTPKPVVVTHSGISQIMDAQKRQFKLNESSRVLLFASQSFDGFFWELCSLLSGAHLVVANAEQLVAGKTLAETISKNKITHVTLPPAVLNLMDNEKMSDLKYIIISGEAPGGKLLSKWVHNRTIINGYGPTESTVCTTLSLPLLPNTIPDIGQPIVNTSVYVLDEFLQPVPPGVCGELYISGSGLARGYLDEPAMTAEKFLPNPFGNPGSRMYRTGDLARWTADHHLMFMGRADNQIKIRGFRVEPNEIETALETHPLVKKAAAKPGKDILGNNLLKAYVTILDDKQDPSTLSPEKLRAFLKKTIPAFMIPAVISIVDDIPLTTNGKINYQALIDNDTEKQSDKTLPSTTTENKLLILFCQLLDLTDIGIDDNFFELGGHSLLGAKLISEIHKEWYLELPIGMLFQYPSISELGKIIDTSFGGKNKIFQTSVSLLKNDAKRADSLFINENIPAYTIDKEPECILLTGVTGFLGAFLLNSLLEKHSKAVIYCLVRESSLQKAKQRIVQNLSRYNLNHLLKNNRIKPLCGDLSLDSLGLSSEDFDEMANKLDCIYHCGAKISSVSSYEELKKNNIKGTYEIIRLASHLKIKPVHYISTLAVAFNNHDPEKILPEDKRLKANEIISSGYTQNKWVEEEMLLSIHKKGLPISIHRPGRISGSCKTGIGNPNDAFWQLVAAMLKIQAVPVFREEQNLYIDLIPVDYAANLIIHFSSDRNFSGKTTNLFHQVKFSLILETLRDMGYHLEKIDFQLWKDKLRHFASQNENQNSLQKALLLSDSLESIFKFSGVNYSTDRIKKEIQQNKIKPPKVERQLLTSYIKHFITTGFFPDPK